MSSLLQGLKFERRSPDDDTRKTKRQKKEKKEKKESKKHKRKRSAAWTKEEKVEEMEPQSRFSRDEWMSMPFERSSSVSKGLEMQLESKTQKRQDEIDAGIREPVTGLVYGLYDPKKPDANPNLVRNGHFQNESSDEMPKVGDGGASWRAKMLQRAHERADATGATFETIVQERYGHVHDLVQGAKGAANEKAHLQSKQLQILESPRHARTKRRRDRTDANVLAAYSKRVQRTTTLETPETDDSTGSNQHGTQKKEQGRNDNDVKRANVPIRRGQASDSPPIQSFSFATTCQALETTSPERLEAEKQRHAFLYGFQSGPSDAKTTVSNTPLASVHEDRKAQLNKLAARALRAQMMGKTALFQQLRDELNELEASLEQENKATKRPHFEAKKGAVQPLEKENLRFGSRKGKKHREPDESNATVSLKELVRKERMARADDTMDSIHARNILRLGSRYKGTEANARAFASGFDEEDQVDLNLVEAPKWTQRAQVERERQLTMHETKQWDERWHKCSFCMKSPAFPNHRLLSWGQFTYLALAKSPRLHPAHCLIVPIDHTCSLVQADEHVMAEITRFQDALARLCAKRYGKSMVFVEQTSAPAKKRHTMMECIPLDTTLTLDLPLYLKQELLQADDEWSTHKPLLDTSKGGIRRHVPPSFPYFHMEWPSPETRRGFAHVIENESKFPREFGASVITGMLETTPRNYGRRESRNSAIEEDKRDVVAFVKDWEPFDWTRELEGGENDRFICH